MPFRGYPWQASQGDRQEGAQQVGPRDLESGSQAAEPVWAAGPRDKSAGKSAKARPASVSDLDFLLFTNTRTAAEMAEQEACFCK